MNSVHATVIATFSRRMRVALPNQQEVAARIKGKRLKPVCGDAVVVQEIESESDWLITEVLPRKNALTRPNIRGRVEVLAANIDVLVVVAAVTPPVDWFIVDRYLCAAENMAVDAIVLYNKIDLGEADTELESYRDIGYPGLYCSAASGAAIEELRALLQKRRAIMVGQSGVGKSSLINTLSGNAGQRVGEVSEKTLEGRHTTVNSTTVTLPGGARIIDSPGVRDYAPALTSPQHVMAGYREVHAASADCRFANCRHLQEPGCAVKAAVEAATISPRRYESYRRLYKLTDRLKQAP